MNDLKWLFDPSPISGNDKGESPFGAMLEDAAGKIGSMISLFVREVISNSADQRSKETSFPVNIFIDFIQISDDAKKAFKKEMDWDALSSHIEAVVGDGESNPSQIELKRSLINMSNDEASSLLVRVSDYNAYGLIGEEADKKSNFHLFCKSVFKTSTDNVRQGSFGLGKGVLYHQSGLNTVLTSSYCNHDGQNKMRVFGRSELQSHETDQGIEYRNTKGCDGAGFFGLPKKEKLGTKPISSFSETEKTLKSLFLDREPEMGTGTTVISTEFKLNGSLENTIEHFKADIKRWFWPALCSEKKPLAVTIRKFKNYEHLEGEDIKVQITSEYTPFATAFKEQENTKDLNEVGNIATKELNWDIPSKKITNNISWDDGKAFTANGVVKMYRSDTSFDNQHLTLNNHIAFLRNNLCVVKYEPINVFSDDSNSNFYGVFLGGEARGDSEEDQKFSDFLRDAEPPLHNDWLYKYKIENYYDLDKVPSFLKKIENDIKLTANDFADISDGISSENLDHLAALFKFGKSGKGEAKRFISDKILDYDLNNNLLTFKVRVNNLREDSSDWKIETFCSIEAAKYQLEIDNVFFDDASLGDHIIINIENKGVLMAIDSSIESFVYSVHALIPDNLSDDLARRQDYKISVVSRG